MITLERAQLAKANSEMRTLFARFAQQKPDGNGGHKVHWTNADAERRYKLLEQQVEKEGKNGTR